MTVCTTLCTTQTMYGILMKMITFFHNDKEVVKYMYKEIKVSSCASAYVFKLM